MTFRFLFIMCTVAIVICLVPNSVTGQTASSTHAFAITGRETTHRPPKFHNSDSKAHWGELSTEPEP